MTFVEQVAAFKGAEKVVGVSGAALANIASRSPGSTCYKFHAEQRSGSVVLDDSGVAKADLSRSSMRGGGRARREATLGQENPNF